MLFNRSFAKCHNNKLYEVLALSCSLRISVKSKKALREKDFSSLKGQDEKLEFVNIILHFYMKSQYDLVQIILMQ